MERAREGVNTCERATMMDSSCQPAWRLLADAYAMNDQYAEAIQAADRALALYPEDYRAMLMKSLSYASMQRFGEAKQWAARADAIRPNDGLIGDYKGELNKAHNAKNMQTAGRVGGGILRVLWVFVSEMFKAVFKSL